MKRSFEFNEAKSHKFWWIETYENKFVVNYGKIGSIGTYEIKEFLNEDVCEKEATKLIKSKIKKGYFECSFDYVNHYYFDDMEYDIDLLTSHPNFREHFNNEMLYCNCGDEETPFGNDTGNDILHILEERIRKNKNFNFVDFPKAILETEWDLTYIQPMSILDEASFLDELKQDKNGLSFDSIINTCDEAIIATAFCQIKITGKISKELKEMALLSLKRQALIYKLNDYGVSDINNKIYKDLLNFNQFS